jgi:hypothetical protein
MFGPRNPPLARRLILACAVFGCVIAAVMPAVQAADPSPNVAAEGIAFFESKIRPILVDNCYDCHAADTDQKASLQLDTRAGVLKGGDTGPAVVAGDPAKSLLVQAVKYQNDHLRMPPDGKLSDEDIDALEQWVTMGAPDPRDGARALTKIEQHLDAAKTHWAFQPVIDPRPGSLDDLTGTVGAPMADRRMLIRRAYLDLVGVPPTISEVDAFAADTSPQAFERVVDGLLADPRYGERWGRHWLDVARYADSEGGNAAKNDSDALPFAWTYRDYVIQSFNDDKPYDRFIQEQLAADQLDSASDPRTLAGLAFLTIGWRKSGTIDDDTLDNAIDTIGRGLLGLTVSCARCHDHKLEPITTQDYYGLFAVLKSCREPATVPALPQAETPEVVEFRRVNRALRSEYARLSIKAASTAAHKARSRLGDYLVLAEESGWKKQDDNKEVFGWVKKRELHGTIHDYVVGSRKTWIEQHPQVFGPFLEFITKQKLDPQPALHPMVAQAFSTPAATLAEVGQRYNEVFARVDGLWRVRNAARIAMPVELTPAELNAYSSDYFDFLDTFQPPFIDKLDALEDQLPLPDANLESLRQVLLAKGSPVRFPSDQVRRVGIIPIGEPDLSSPTISEVTKLIKQHPGAPAWPMAFCDKPEPFAGYVYVRGDSAVRGPDAPRRFITAFRDLFPNTFPEKKSGRLELAQAITSPRNPLTARVIVNRVWAWHFGTPIVGTPSDFGFQGDKPTNQPLLDHLAAWFMEHGWSFKRLHKYLMLSAAYRRADFPPRPLELESLRDAVLAVSGRLELTRFGKPVRGGTDTRRTVYGFVSRSLLPSLYRSFDFPNPMFSAPQRARSMLVPRALILMNSPLLVDSAKALAASLMKACADDVARVDELYRRVLQRSPDESELQTALAYMAAYPPNDIVHPESRDWQYGFGVFDGETKSLKTFVSIPSFDGKAFRANATSDDGKSGAVMLDAMGGDAGPGAGLSSIRRWVAPEHGAVDITAELTHADPETAGIVARIISSRTGQLGQWEAIGNSVPTNLKSVAVKKGDMIDFVVSSHADKDPGPYQWSPSILMPDAEMPGMDGTPRRWDARTDFADPGKPAQPLTALEELSQALLLSPEFALVE